MARSVRRLVLATTTTMVLVVPALAASAPGTGGQLRGIAFAPQCPVGQVCVDVDLNRGVIASTANKPGKYELSLLVEYLQDGGLVAKQSVPVPLPSALDPKFVAPRVVFDIPDNLVGQLTVDVRGFLVKVTSASPDVPQRPPGARTFYVDETGVVSGRVTVPPCDDRDDDPNNDCPESPAD